MGINHRDYSFAFFLGAVGLGGCELGLPKLVRDGLVNLPEDKIEDFRVPADGVAFDSTFDVLFHPVSQLCLGYGQRVGVTYLWQFQPVGHVVSWEDDSLRTRASSSYRLLSQTTNPEDLAGHGEFTGHRNGRFDRFVEGQRNQRRCHRNASGWTYGRTSSVSSLLVTRGQSRYLPSF